MTLIPTRALNRLRVGFFAVYPEGHEDEGQLITHDKLCECGEEFTQFMPSERFMESVEARGPHALELFARQIPGLWVPVHCPKCERHDLTLQARLDEVRRDAAA